LLPGSVSTRDRIAYVMSLAIVTDGAGADEQRRGPLMGPEYGDGETREREQE